MRPAIESRTRKTYPLLTEQQFKMAKQRARLQNSKSLEAAYDVLVKGATATTASVAHGIQISAVARVCRKMTRGSLNDGVCPCCGKAY